MHKKIYKFFTNMACKFFDDLKSQYKPITKSGRFWMTFGSLAIVFFFLFAINWIYRKFGSCNLDEVFVMMNIGVRGASSWLVSSFIGHVILDAIVFSFVASFFFYFKFKYTRLVQIILLALIVGNGARNISMVDTGSVFKMQSYSLFYEQEYKDPENVEIKFPKKHNVVVVVLESIEKSYDDKRVFGKSLIPKISKLEKENLTFTKYNSLAGMTYTIGAITGMVTGLPLLYIKNARFDKMVGAKGLGDILSENGFETYGFFPSGNYSNKGDFLQQHGFKHIVNGESMQGSALDHGEHPFYGVDDVTFYQEIKPHIEQIVKNNKTNYFILMETINTHVEGYTTKNCENMGFKQDNLEDIIKCEDKIIYDFVQWMRQKDPTAVIILVNDHPTMFTEMRDKIKHKKSYPMSNVFINTNMFDNTDKHRPISGFDIFPMAIEAAGGVITDCRLGLGTGMSERCAGVKTLREKYGDNKLNLLLQQKNKLYYKLITGHKI